MRDRILDAATRLYLREGTERATLSAIADEAGVSRPTVYKHVGGRDAIAAALLDRELEVFFGLLRDVLDAEADPRARVVEGVTFAVRYAEDHDLFQRLLEVEPGVVIPQLTTKGRPVIEAAIEVLEPYLIEARQQEQIRRVDPRRAAEWITRVGISLILTPLPPVDREEERLRALLDEMFESMFSRG